MRIRAGSQAKTGMAEEKETKGIDYQTWEFTGREYLEIAGISLGIAAAVNLLCYRAWWACIAVVPVGIVCFHTYRKNRIQRRKEELYDSFRDLIAWMHTALRSGYSMEMQCWRRQDSWNSRWEKKTFWYRNCAGCVINDDFRAGGTTVSGSCGAKPH